MLCNTKHHYSVVLAPKFVYAVLLPRMLYYLIFKCFLKPCLLSEVFSFLQAALGYFFPCAFPVLCVFLVTAVILWWWYCLLMRWAGSPDCELSEGKDSTMFYPVHVSST